MTEPLIIDSSNSSKSAAQTQSEDDEVETQIPNDVENDSLIEENSDNSEDFAV